MPTSTLKQKQKPMIPAGKRFIFGIDPGVRTGIALWDRQVKGFMMVESGPILVAMATVLKWKGYGDVFIRIEDARQRKWFGKTQREVLQGAGSIKRDCQIWEEFVELHNIPHEFVAPKNNVTKLDAKLFGRYTGFRGQTNSHARDAAMLVYAI